MSPKNPKRFLIRTLLFAAFLIACSFGEDICGTGDEYGLPIFTPADTGISKLPTSYNPGLLQGYFSAGKSFMSSVQSRNFGKYLKGFISGNDQGKEKIKDFEIPIIVVAAFGLIFALLMPCVGCCVYRRKKMIQSHHFHQKRCAIMSCLLLSVVLFMFVMNICMFTTNERVHNAAKELGPMANAVINEAVTFSKAILSDIKSIMTQQVPCIAKMVLNELGSTRLAEGVQELVQNILSNLIEKGIQLADNLQDIAKDLSEIIHNTNRLISMEETLRQQIDLITINLQNVTAKCGINDTGKTNQGTCNKLRNVIITTSVDYKNLPNVTEESNNTEAILKKDLAKQMHKTNSVITNMPSTVYQQTQNEKRNINSSIQNMETVITKELQNVSRDVENETINEREAYEEYNVKYLNRDTSDYFKYETIRWSVFIVLSCMVFLVVLLLSCGLCCNCWAFLKNPGEREQRVQGGRKCITWGVVFMFLFSFILMTCCVVTYIAGIHLHIVCRDMKDGEALDLLIEGKIDISRSLQNCRQNQALYTALNAATLFNFNVTQELNVTKQAEGFDEEIQKFKIDLSDQEVLSTDGEEALRNVATAGIEKIDHEKFNNLLLANITDEETSITIIKLSGTAEDLRKEMEPGIAQEVEDIITLVRALEDIVRNITADIMMLRGTLSRLKVASEDIVHNSRTLLQDLRNASQVIKHGLGNETDKLMEGFKTTLINVLNKATKHLIDQVETKVARCKPVANIYDGALNTFVCENIIQNFNGFWLALGCCLLLFIPAIILSMRLLRHYEEMAHSQLILKDLFPCFDKSAGGVPVRTRNTDSDNSEFEMNAIDSAGTPVIHRNNSKNYEWQWNYGGKWDGVAPFLNEDIERSFCDPANSIYRGNGIILDFSHSVNKYFYEQGSNTPYRRVSSKSSIWGSNEPGLTYWRWYWKKADDEWEEYHTWTTSDEIEKAYSKNQKEFGFQTSQYQYKILFDKMIQENQDDNIKTIREVRRRPLLEPDNQVINRVYPSHWPQNLKKVIKIPVNGSRYNELSSKFKTSMGTTNVQIINIQEICNPDFYDRYEAKKTKMAKKEYSHNQKELYHGTGHDTCEAICQQNFDFRLNGKNATVYGQGSYFAKNASYSNFYAVADPSGKQYIFIAQVLVGRYVKGDKTYKRPPKLPGEEFELYDSCVDNTSNPSIYVVFELDQCYPRYLVTYKKN